jgi:anti-sigma B factor antagonist
MRPGELDVSHEQRGSSHTLRLAGELDLACADELERRIATLCVEGATSIELDLAELSFVDSSGLRAMLAGRQICERSGCELELSNCGEHVRRILELTGMDGVLRVRGDSTPAPTDCGVESTSDTGSQQ